MIHGGNTAELRNTVEWQFKDTVASGSGQRASHKSHVPSFDTREYSVETRKQNVKMNQGPHVAIVIRRVVKMARECS